MQTASAIGVCLTALGVSSQALAQDAPDQDAGAAAGDHAKAAKPNGVREVVVTGVRPLLGDKLPARVQDVPQSVSLVPQKLLQAQAATRLEDALKNVPGITLNAGEGAARGDTVNLRGFSAFNDFFLDGIRDAAVYSRDSFNLESVEVLKGPSATLFGRGSTGGAINQVSKAPTLNSFRVLTADVGTNNEYRGTLDIDQPIGPSAAFRFDAMGESSGVAERDNVTNRRWGAAPSLSLGIGEPTSVTFAYLHQQEDDTPDVGVPFVGGAPAHIDRANDYGLTSNRTTAQDDIGTVRVTHDFSPSLILSNTFRAANYAFDYQFDAPNFGSVAGGGQGAPTPGEPLSAILVGRDSPSSSGVQTNFTDQLDLTARFNTGFASHDLVTGFELARQTNDLVRYVNPFNTNNNWIPETSLLRPDPDMVSPPEGPSAIQNTTADSEAAYVTDTIGLGRYVSVIGGVRFDRFAAYYKQLTLATSATLDLSHVDTVFSPHAALVIKPTPNQSYYFSYGTSFDPSAEALTLTTKTADLGPVKGTTFEVGGKATVLHGLLLTGALFHTEVDNAQINDPDNPTLTVLEGNETVNGLELGASGHITRELEITAGYTYLDGAMTGAMGTNPVIRYAGALVPNLARNAVNLWAEYEITDAWEVGFGGNYLDKRAANIPNPTSVPAIAFVPSYVVLNAMTSYRVNDHLTLQINAFNLLNAVYYDAIYYTSASENHAIPGAGRTVKLTARVGF